MSHKFQGFDLYNRFFVRILSKMSGYGLIFDDDLYDQMIFLLYNPNKLAELGLSNPLNKSK